MTNEIKPEPNAIAETELIGLLDEGLQSEPITLDAAERQRIRDDVYREYETIQTERYE